MKNLVKIHIPSENNQVIDLPIGSEITSVTEERNNLVLHINMPKDEFDKEKYIVKVQEPSAQFAEESSKYIFANTIKFSTGTSFFVGIGKMENI